MATPPCPRCGSKLFDMGLVLRCEKALHEGGECDYAEVRKDFSVPVVNLARLTAKVERLARRAVRLGCPAPVITVGERHSERMQRSDGEKFWVEFAAVTVSGEAPRIGGWTFAATVDHDGEENIIRGVGGRAKGEEAGYPVKYRTALPACDHCHTERKRAETFLLLSDGGEWKQIGRSCLRDFLGHSDPSQIAAAAELLAEAMEEASDCWDDFDGGGHAGDPDIEFFLAYVACAIRLGGWVPRSAKSGEPTVDVATGWLYGNLAAAKSRSAKEYPRPLAEDYALATAALEWARALPGEGEFESSLRACSKRVAVKPKNAGLTAFIIAGYTKAQVAKHERAESHYLGTCDGKACSAGCAVGGKATRYGAGKGKHAVAEIEVVVTKIVPIEGFRDSYAYLHIMRSTSGDVLVWKSSSSVLKEGARYALTGSVKGHKDYNGTKQTTLTRCDARRLDADQDAVGSGQVRKGRDGVLMVVGKKYMGDVDGNSHYEIERIDIATGCRYSGQMRDVRIVEEFPVRLDELPPIPTVVEGERRLIGEEGAYIIVGPRPLTSHTMAGEHRCTMYMPDGSTLDLGTYTPREIVENFPVVAPAEVAAA